MPWKKDGEKWHLGEKGFPPGRGAKWDRALLPKLVKLLREIDPTLEFKWDVRDAVTVRPQGSPRFWARLKTKEADALEIWFDRPPRANHALPVRGLRPKCGNRERPHRRQRSAETLDGDGESPPAR